MYEAQRVRPRLRLIKEMTKTSVVLFRWVTEDGPCDASSVLWHETDSHPCASRPCNATSAMPIPRPPCIINDFIWEALSVKTSLFTYAYHGASKSIRSRHSLFTMWPLRVCPPGKARTAEHYEYREMSSMTLNMGQCLLTYSKVFSNAVLLFKIQQYVIV